MLTPINFNYQSAFGAIKICDEMIDGALAIEFVLVIAQEIVPDFSFGGGHAFAQTASIFDKVGIVRQ